MALNFIGFINTNTPGLTTAQKQAMLMDFTTILGYQELVDGEPNQQTRAQFANEKVQNFIMHAVNLRRKNVAEEAVVIEELELE